MNPLDFFEKYTLIGSVDLYKTLKPQKCRFCGEESSDFFKNDSHLIPELLGENNFIAKDECDKCNSFFSRYESHLAIFARPFLAISNIKTKRKTPVFQSRSDENHIKRTTIKIDSKTNTRLINADINDFILDKENNTFQLTIRNPKFRPIYLYKILTKIVLSLMPSELVDKNRELFNWVLDKSNAIEVPHAFQTKLLKTYFTSPSAMLYQANKLVINDTEYPEFIGIICFANTVIQFYLPMSDKHKEIHSDKNKLDLLIYPAFAYDKQTSEKFKILHMNLTNREYYEHNEKLSFKGNL